jgi:hypothetical protein
LDKLALYKLELDKLESDKFESDKLELDKLESDKFESDKLESDKLELAILRMKHRAVSNRCLVYDQIFLVVSFKIEMSRSGRTCCHCYHGGRVTR